MRTTGGTSLHTIKHHASQGTRKRRFGAELPEELQNMSDEELADRNARVWAVVLADCQRAAGVELDAFPNTRQSNETGLRNRQAFAAALTIAVREYGIPITRVQEFAERGDSLTRVHRRYKDDPEVLRLIEAWEQNGGRKHVQQSAVSRQVDVPAHVYESLARRAARAGVSIEALLVNIIGADG
jgi:hypothetical protein